MEFRSATALMVDAYCQREKRNKEPLDSIESRGSEFKCRHGPTFPLKQYHWPHRLNGRVRNGNGCCPVGMGTDKNHHPALTGWRLFTFRQSIQGLRSTSVRCPLSVVRCKCN